MPENVYLKFGDQEVCSAADGMPQIHCRVQIRILFKQINQLDATVS
jgi:hypothetical protein